MPRVRLFISHSSHTPADIKRLQHVCDAVGKTRCCTVLVDARCINGGDVWREKIHAMLTECHAGMILLNRDALDSPWVLSAVTRFFL